MRRTVTGVLSAVAFSATALVAAQGSAQQQQTQPPPTTPPVQEQKTEKPEVSLTGCVIQGLTPTTFVLDSAKMKDTDPAEKMRTFVLVAAAEDLDFRSYLNHKVTVTGAAEDRVPPVPPPGQKVAEKDLPKLSAKRVVSIADTCSSPSR